MYKSTIASSITNFIFSLAELSIIFRIIFKLFPRAEELPITGVLFNFTGFLLAPILKRFSEYSFKNGSVVELGSLVGLLVYFLSGYLLVIIFDKMVEIVNRKSSR